MRAEEAIRQFQESCKVAFLATCDADKPRVRPMSPVSVEGNVIWMAAQASSEKMSQLAGNPNVEVCYLDADHRHLRLRGRAEVCEDADVKRRMWEGYPLMHRYFKSPQDPEYALLKVAVDEAMLMDSMSMEYQRLEV